MGVTGSQLNCFQEWWPMTDTPTIQDRVLALEQKQTVIEYTHNVLDRKYSELDVNDELSNQHIRTLLHDVKQLMIRLDRAETKINSMSHENGEMIDNDIVILRS